MQPGEHIILFGSEGLQAARKEGLHVRDTLLVLQPEKILLVYLCRYPVEHTIIHNIQAYGHGTGALNINGCRVMSGQKQVSAGATTSEACYEGGWQGAYEKGTGRVYSTEGRWPTNLLFVHGAKCKQTGMSRVSETVVWDCQPDCPAKRLDRMSGNRKSAYVGNPEGALLEQGATRVNPKRGNVYAPGLDTKPCGVLYSDFGGASRFFPQFPDLREALEWLGKLIDSDQTIGLK